MGKYSKFAALLCLALFFTLALTSQEKSTRIDDDSDWWSIIRQNDDAPRIEPRQEDTPSSAFRVLNVTIGDDEIPQVINKLGQTTIVHRGDASTGREQVCYVSATTQNVYLAFESGEVQYAFYLFSDGPDWNGRDACLSSKRVSSALTTSLGLHLGQNPSEIEAVLGAPTVRQKDRFIYFRSARKKTPPKQLLELRKYHSDLSSRKFLEYYEYFDLTVHIEIEFANSKMTYLAVSKSETN